MSKTEASLVADEVSIQPKQADEILPVRTHAQGGLDESIHKGVFSPVDIGVLYEEVEEDVPWVLEGYLAEGVWTLLAGPPKLGKTTFAYDAIVAVATGKSFLGREVAQKKVLLLGLEEHRRDIVARLRRSGGDEILGLVKVIFAPLPYDPAVFHDMHSYIMQENIGLVVVDTLHAWWRLPDENDAGQVNKYGHPLLQLIRSTKAAWLVLAHTRKQGGEHGQEIRGSSALAGLLDIAISMKRTGGVNQQRSLEAISRYADSPIKLIVQKGEDGYEVLGTPDEVSTKAKAEKFGAALTENDQSTEELIKATGLSKQDIARASATLKDGVLRTGKGCKGSPYCYRRNSIHPTSEPNPEPLDKSKEQLEPVAG